MESFAECLATCGPPHMDTVILGVVIFAVEFAIARSKLPANSTVELIGMALGKAVERVRKPKQ